MTRIAKLYAAISTNPHATLSFRDFEKLLRAFGFTLERIKGSHRQYVHAKVPWVLTVLPEGKDAKHYQVRQFLGMIDAFGLSIEE